MLVVELDPGLDLDDGGVDELDRLHPVAALVVVGVLERRARLAEQAQRVVHLRLSIRYRGRRDGRSEQAGEQQRRELPRVSHSSLSSWTVGERTRARRGR